MPSAIDSITVYGAYWCPDCRRAKQFLGEDQIPSEWIDVEQDPDAERFVIGDGSHLGEPSNALLAAKLGLRTTVARKHFPLTAGYATRELAALETSAPGVFAAGDVRHGSTKQVASAAGEGAAVTLLVREYLKPV